MLLDLDIRVFTECRQLNKSAPSGKPDIRTGLVCITPWERIFLFVFQDLFADQCHPVSELFHCWGVRACWDGGRIKSEFEPPSNMGLVVKEVEEVVVGPVLKFWKGEGGAELRWATTPSKTSARFLFSVCFSFSFSCVYWKAFLGAACHNSFCWKLYIFGNFKATLNVEEFFL